MKHLKKFKVFQNFQGVQTLRDLIGNVETEINDLLVTDKGILVKN